ncbi:hypothetical protein GGR54DRAFT_414888, partial [Hypoxylon sp. NC1633]
MTPFIERGNHLALPLRFRSPSARDCDGSVASSLALHGRGGINRNTVQQKTIALHRAQSMSGSIVKGRGLVAAFECDYPNCQKGPFKRRQHLKRHKNTNHAENPITTTYCPFCKKSSNRTDNYRQHLKLHTQKRRPAHRTEYHPNAQGLLDEEVNKLKRRAGLRGKKIIELDKDDGGENYR